MPTRTLPLPRRPEQDLALVDVLRLARGKRDGVRDRFGRERKSHRTCRCPAVASPAPLLAPVMTTTLPSMSLPILRVADFLHPVDGLAVEPFLDGDVRHGARRR